MWRTYYIIPCIWFGLSLFLTRRHGVLTNIIRHCEQGRWRQNVDSRISSASYPTHIFSSYKMRWLIFWSLNDFSWIDVFNIQLDLHTSNVVGLMKTLWISYKLKLKLLKDYLLIELKLYFLLLNMYQCVLVCLQNE